MFLENPGHRGPFLAEVRYAWTSHLLGEFMPVTWMSYAAGPPVLGPPRSRLPPDQRPAARPGGVGRVCAARRLSCASLWARIARAVSAIDRRGRGGGARVRAPPAPRGARGLGQRPRDGAGRAPPDPLGPRVRDRMGARPGDRASAGARGSRRPPSCSSPRSSRARQAWSCPLCWWCWTSIRFAGSAAARRGGGARRLAASWAEKARVRRDRRARDADGLPRARGGGGGLPPGRVGSPDLARVGRLHDRVLRVEDGRRRDARARSTACRRERIRCSAPCSERGAPRWR